MLEFQPRKFNTPDLGSVGYCYVAYLLDPPHPLISPYNVPPPQPPPSILVMHGASAHLGVTGLCPVILKQFFHLSLIRHFQRPTPPLPPRPHHACRITITAAPTLHPKYLLTWISAVFPQLLITTTDLATSPLPRIPSPWHIPRR